MPIRIVRLGSPRAPDEGNRTLDLLATLYAHVNFPVRCYCEDEAKCHRSVPRELQTGKGAVLVV